MGESSSTSSSSPAPAAPVPRLRRLPWAALVALVIIAALEVFIASSPRLFTDGIYWTTSAKRRLMADRSRHESVLIFGDSRAFSIRPGLVAEALGRGDTVTNYSWAFMGAPAYEFMLDVYLRLKPPPRLILVNPLPELVALPPRMLKIHEPPIHRTRLFTALPSRPLMAELVARREWSMAGDLARHLAMPPSVHRRDRVWKAVQGLALGRGFAGPGEIDLHQMEGMAEHGAFLMHLDTRVTPPVFAQAERLNGPYGVYDNKEAVAAYERFLARARAEGIEVRMMGIPLPETTYNRYEEVGALAAWRKLLERWTREYPNFGLIEPVLIRWPNERFGDAGHLNLAGDREFQKLYREALARAAPGRAR